MSEEELRESIAQEILKWHTPEDNRTPCCYLECTHEEDASIARGIVLE